LVVGPGPTDPLIPNKNNKYYEMEIFQEAPAVGSFKTGSPEKKISFQRNARKLYKTY
jgi:hypothetical protein